MCNGNGRKLGDLVQAVGVFAAVLGFWGLIVLDIELHQGDCLDILPTLEEGSVDTCICDPPYGLNFMGKDWDHGVPGVRFWRAVKRVLKPGAMLLAFGGTRTHHRLMVAIEDAGFELRDTMMWVYGSGFPKSHDISKAMDKAAGAEREVVGRKTYAGPTGNDDNFGVGDKSTNPGKRHITAPATPEAETWDGWGTALKPAWEPIIVAMNPRDGTFVNNALKWGVSGIWVDGGRIAHNEECRMMKPSQANIESPSEKCRQAGRREPTLELKPSGRWPANFILSHHPECVRRGVKRVKGSRIDKPCDYKGKAGAFGNDGARPARGIGD